MSAPRPPRVRVTHPRTEAARRVGHRPASQEIDEQTRLGELYMQTLVRSQARLAVTVCLAVVVLLGGIALAFAFVPALAHAHVLGVGLAWIVLGVAVYPVLLLIGRFAVRRAERAEREFTELMRR